MSSSASANELKEEGESIREGQKVSGEALGADVSRLAKNMTVDELLENSVVNGPDDQGISSSEVANESRYEPFRSESSHSSDAEDNQTTSSLVVGDNVSAQQPDVGFAHRADYRNSLKNSSNSEMYKDSSISPSRQPRRG